MPKANLAYSTVATAPAPAISGGSLVVATGEGARFTDSPPFYVTVGAVGVILTPANSEIMLCTAVSADTLTFDTTVSRNKLGTTARTVLVGDQIFQGEYSSDFEVHPNLQVIPANEVVRIPDNSSIIVIEKYSMGDAALLSMGDGAILRFTSGEDTLPAVGSASQVLTIVGGIAAWATPSPLITTSTMAGGPPASPSDGDIWIATAVDAHGTRWAFQYNAGAASAFKWESIGGSPMVSTGLSGSITTSSNVLVALTGGPSLAVPRSGEYVVMLRCAAQNNATILNGVIAEAVGSIAGNLNAYGEAVLSPEATSEQTLTAFSGQASLTAGETVTIKVRSTAAVSTIFANGVLSIQPTKIS